MISDQDLINQYLNGDEKSLEVLIKKYLKPIYSFVFNFVPDPQIAQDLTQEIFLKMWRNLKKFDRNKNLAPYRTKGSGSGFKSWLFTIAKNTCYDYLRKKKKDLAFNVEDWFSFEDSKILPDEISEKNFLLEDIKKTFEKLSSKAKEILNLYYFEGLNFREISEFLGESINTVKSRHSRAIKKIKKMLKIE
jgi:RNA polymerase sigma-70 factor (ECF subfamily)